MSDLSPVKFDLHTVIPWEEWKLECVPNVKHAATLKIPHVKSFERHSGNVIVIAAAPSINDYVDTIKMLNNDKDIIMTVNGAHEWALKNGIIPNIHVIFEPDLPNVKTALGGKPHPGVVYYICSNCPRAIFDELAAYRCVLWHANHSPEEYQKLIADTFPGEFMVSGGYATFFRVITIAAILGYRNFELFGVDSSFSDESHVAGYQTKDKEENVNIWGVDLSSGDQKKFTTHGGLAYQADMFMKYCANNSHLGLRFRVHGNGLLRYIHEGGYPENYHKET